MTPLFVISSTPAASADPATSTTKQNGTSASPQKGPVELLGAATETTRYWRYPDGRVTTEMWPRPVRVKKSGAWAWIDTSLTQQDGVVRPKVIKGDLSLPAGEGGGANTTIFSPTPNQSLALAWPAGLPKPKIEGSRATYADAAGSGADLVVTARPTGFRYDIVLRTRPAKALELKIPVKGHGLSLRKASDGRLRVTDAENRNVAFAPNPSVRGKQTTRSRAATNSTVDTTVLTDSGKQTLVLKPDAAYLADPDTAYPVTIQSAFSITATVDADVWNLTPDDSNADGEYLQAGTDSDGSKSRAYLKFDISPLVGQNISNVTLSLLNIDGPNCGTSVGAGIQVRRVTSAWDASTVTWNAQPTNTTENSVINKTSAGGNCDPAPMNWDITSMAQQWAGDVGNYGLILMSPTENNSANYRVYPSADNTEGWDNPPKLTATFSPSGGPTVVNPAGSDGVEVFTAPNDWRMDLLQIAEGQAHALSSAYDRVEANGDALAPPYVDMVTGNVFIPAATADGRTVASASLTGTAYLGLGGIDWTLPGTFTDETDEEDTEAPAGSTEGYSFNPQVPDMANSYNRLSTIATEIPTLDASLIPGIDGVVDASPWPERNQVLVTANTVTAGLRSALAQRYGTNTVTIWLNPDATRGQVQDTRDDDNDGYINGGGAFVTSKGYGCTTGFAWSVPDGRRMVTAGHCFPDDNTLQDVIRAKQIIGGALASTWIDGTGSVKLPTQTKTYGDAAIVAYYDPIKPTASIFVGGVTSGQKRPVKRSWTRRAVPGDLFCVGGRTTGQTCNWKVEEVNKPIPEYHPNGTFAGTVRNGSMGQRFGGCTDSGDSGGPIFTIEPDGYVVAKGILSGGKGALGACNANFTDIQDVRKAFGGDVMKRKVKAG